MRNLAFALPHTVVRPSMYIISWRVRLEIVPSRARLRASSMSSSRPAISQTFLLILRSRNAPLTTPAILSSLMRSAFLKMRML